MPIYIEPLGAVDKATAPFQRLITDSRLSNEIHQDWGVWYNSAEHFSTLLDFGDILFVDDMTDAYIRSRIQNFISFKSRIHHGSSVG
jgi:hypothetical protein